MDGRATFTIAMSSTTMNCTPRSSASANHFRRVDAIMVSSFQSSSRDWRVYRRDLRLASICLSIRREPATLTDREQEVRAVLPGGARPLAGGRALGAADRPRAPARPEALHG